MILPFAELRDRIPANKFYPPPLHSEQHLFRRRLVERILKKPTPRIIVIETQAGQGNTIFAVQVLITSDAPFAWYQIGPEESDPVLLLTVLLTCLMNAVPNFRSPLLEEMVSKRKISPSELIRLDRKSSRRIILITSKNKFIFQLTL